MTLNYERKINNGSALLLVSEANQRRYSSPWRYFRRGAIFANFETLGSKFSQRDWRSQALTAPPPKKGIKKKEYKI